MDDYTHYALTSSKPTIACFGTGFPSMAALEAYVRDLQSVGLCTHYAVLGLKDRQWHPVVDRTADDAEGRVILPRPDLPVDPAVAWAKDLMGSFTG